MNQQDGGGGGVGEVWVVAMVLRSNVQYRQYGLNERFDVAQNFKNKQAK